MAGQRALRPCRAPGCPRYAESGSSTCITHKAQSRPNRGPAAAYHYLYNTRAWIDGRAAFQSIHPLCVECQKQSTLSAATIVDHVEPHRGDPALFYDQSNWQPLCKPHHDTKTVAEDCGFGNK